MQNHQENGAVGAEDAPDFASVEGFVDEDDEEDAQDAHAPDAQPIEVDIPKTYHWGVVAARLEAWQYKASEKTAQGTLDELRSLVDWTDAGNQCVWQSIKSASLTRGGKESVANGLVTIIVEEYDVYVTSTFLREHGFVACNLEITAETVENGAVVDADINLGARVLDLYHAAGGSTRSHCLFGLSACVREHSTTRRIPESSHDLFQEKKRLNKLPFLPSLDGESGGS